MMFPDLVVMQSPTYLGRQIYYVYINENILRLVHEQDNMVLGPLLNDKVDVLEQLESPGVT